MSFSTLLLISMISHLIPADASEAKIIFRKSLDTEIPYTYAAGFPINITLGIHNIGTGSAYNLKTSDPWPRQYFDIDGETEAEFAEIKGGETLEHNFTVTPKFDATPEKPLLYVRGFSAELSFSKDEEGEDQTKALSTQMRDLLVRSKEDYIRFTAKHNTEWAIFGLGTTAAVFGPLVAYIMVSKQGGLPIPRSKKE
mmetsp:Transcript_15270/g.21247  ORF Transcript_15270/g.21247 Transcript_15270/m.21247 type:complete len:197 (-) Transcript_15270:255-845(-)